MAEDNPFAPTGVHPEPQGHHAAARVVDVAAARAALSRYTRDDALLAVDRAVRGRVVRLGGLIAAAVGGVALLVAGLLAVAGGDASFVGGLLVGLIAIFATLTGLVMLALDLRLTDRGTEHKVDAAAITYWRTLATRPKVAWSTLAPTARGADVPAPVLPPVPTGPGVFTLHDWRIFRDWTRTFAVSGHGQTRSCQWRSTTLLRQDDDYAETRTVLRVGALPQWAMIAAVVAFVLVRLIGILVFAGLFLFFRKTVDVTVEQRWLRGADGAWYLLDAAIVSA